MGTTLTVGIDIESVTKILRQIGEKACQQAWRRTLKKSARWMIHQSAKAISQQVLIPQKVVKKRLYFFSKSTVSGKVWLGLNPIEAHLLGRPKQTRTGVSVGRHRFPGAWLMRYRAPNGPVFQRLSPKSAIYRKVTVEWSSIGQSAFTTTARQLRSRLLTLLSQEVNYEIHKALAKN